MTEVIETQTPRYVLATAAYNEERHIEETLNSVARQRISPTLWIIVSDGSTDRTDEIVQRYAERHTFIQFIRVEKTEKHNFAAKVHALRRAFAQFENVRYDFLGILDADVRFDAGYFEQLLGRFQRQPQLGVAGGDIQQLVGGQVVPRVKDMNSVAGGVQFMRRECFEQTGGLPALKFGGEDAALEIAARKHGWQTRTFPELKVTHFGFVGAGAGGRLQARYKWGRMNHALGYHPLYELVRCAFRSSERPYIVGSAAELAGFVVGRLKDGVPAIDGEVVKYLRAEQLRKLRRPFSCRG